MSRFVFFFFFLTIVGLAHASWESCTAIGIPGFQGDLCVSAVLVGLTQVEFAVQLGAHRFAASPIDIALLADKAWHGLMIPVILGTTLHFNISSVHVHLPPRPRLAACLEADVRVMGYSVAEKDFPCFDLHAARDDL